MILKFIINICAFALSLEMDGFLIIDGYSFQIDYIINFWWFLALLPIFEQMQCQNKTRIA